MWISPCPWTHKGGSSTNVHRDNRNERSSEGPRWSVYHYESLALAGSGAAGCRGATSASVSGYYRRREEKGRARDREWRGERRHGRLQLHRRWLWPDHKDFGGYLTEASRRNTWWLARSGRVCSIVAHPSRENRHSLSTAGNYYPSSVACNRFASTMSFPGPSPGPGSLNWFTGLRIPRGEQNYN